MNSLFLFLFFLLSAHGMLNSISRGLQVSSRRASGIAAGKFTVGASKLIHELAPVASQARFSSPSSHSSFSSLSRAWRLSKGTDSSLGSSASEVHSLSLQSKNPGWMRAMEGLKDADALLFFLESLAEELDAHHSTLLGSSLKLHHALKEFIFLNRKIWDCASCGKEEVEMSNKLLKRLVEEVSSSLAEVSLGRYSLVKNLEKAQSLSVPSLHAPPSQFDRMLNENWSVEVSDLLSPPIGSLTRALSSSPSISTVLSSLYELEVAAGKSLRKSQEMSENAAEMKRFGRVLVKRAEGIEGTCSEAWRRANVKAILGLLAFGTCSTVWGANQLYSEGSAEPRAQFFLPPSPEEKYNAALTQKQIQERSILNLEMEEGYLKEAKEVLLKFKNIENSLEKGGAKSEKAVLSVLELLVQSKDELKRVAEELRRKEEKKESAHEWIVSLQADGHTESVSEALDDLLNKFSLRLMIAEDEIRSGQWNGGGETPPLVRRLELDSKEALEVLKGMGRKLALEKRKVELEVFRGSFIVDQLYSEKVREDLMRPTMPYRALDEAADRSHVQLLTSELLKEEQKIQRAISPARSLILDTISYFERIHLSEQVWREILLSSSNGKPSEQQEQILRWFSAVIEFLDQRLYEERSGVRNSIRLLSDDPWKLMKIKYHFVNWRADWAESFHLSAFRRMRKKSEKAFRASLASSDHEGQKKAVLELLQLKEMLVNLTLDRNMKMYSWLSKAARLSLEDLEAIHRASLFHLGQDSLERSAPTLAKTVRIAHSHEVERRGVEVTRRGREMAEKVKATKG